MKDISLILYVEIDVLCILLLIYVMYKSFRNIESRKSWQFFQVSLLFVTLCIGTDLVWKLMESRVLPNQAPFSYLVNSLYFILSVLATSCWFFFTEFEIGSGVLGNHPWDFFLVIPAVTMVVLLIAGYFNGCLFYFDENGIFVRGPLNILAFLIPLFYLICCVAHAVSRAVRKENYPQRKTYLNLAGFALISLFTSLLQIPFPGTPLPCIGISLASLMVYINSQELLVSLDPLTKLNNRYHMVRFLSGKLEHLSEKLSLYLLMVDMDHFKQINDLYGHVEGDRALIRMAAVLKQTAAAYNCFVSRYGGDEFIIIYETEKEEMIEEMSQFIHRKLEEENRMSGANYHLRTSIGYAKYGGDIQYIPDFIAAADRSLYAVKKAKKG